MPRRLDPELLNKLAKKIDKSVKYTREQNAKRASRAGVSSEAHFLHWLKEEKIGFQKYKRSLPVDIQTEFCYSCSKKLFCNCLCINVNQTE